jgi:peptidoglycan/LPS O-acetylase OafA/YrhL
VNPEANERLTRSWRRLDGVDLLRGIAILSVMLNHVCIRLLGAKVPLLTVMSRHLFRVLFFNGQYGVQIFFVVSGFLITSTAIKRWGTLRRVSVRDFYSLRFARIAPLFVALLAVLSIFHFVGLKDFRVGAETGGLGRALFAALTFHINVLEAHRGYLPGNWDILWSLSVEEVFYLAFPILCWLFGQNKLLPAVMVAFVIAGPIQRAALAHGNEIWREYSYLGGMDAIALGCLAAMVMTTTKFSARTLNFCAPVGMLLMAFILGSPYHVFHWGLTHDGMDMSILAVGTCLVIVSAAQGQWRSPRLLFPLLRLGQRSYEVYLTHMFMVFAFFDVFVQIGKPMKGISILFLTVIVIAGLIGEFVARFYSEPLNRKLRHYGGDGADKLGQFWMMIPLCLGLFRQDENAEHRTNDLVYADPDGHASRAVISP